MALKDQIPFGMSLPHRSPDAIDVTAVRTVAQRAEALGFRDLWVTENTLDHVTSFDPIGVLTYAAAVTQRIRLGASVVVLAIHSPMTVAHQWATLDRLSGGRAILGVGLGREHHYEQYSVPQTGRVRRFREEVELIRALWTQDRVNYHGTFYQLEGGTMPLKPVQKPLPLWMGVGHPDAVRRAASLADGWARAAPASRNSHAPYRCCVRPWSGQGAIPRNTRSQSAYSWRWMNGPRWRVRSCTGGSRKCTTTRPALMRRVSTARRNRCARNWATWSQWAPIISC
jgi:alkanesulfonate monooxygenase SsuD/methylene tetrahydromethanopterin reductase-like flavin-dependent oxidoreductase (luciferase family)